MNISQATLVDTPKEERHVALRKHPRMNRKGLDCVADVLVRAEYGLRTDDWDFKYAYDEAWQLAFRKRSAELALSWLRENRPNLVFANYRRGTSLDGYIKSVETSCVAPSGTASLEKQHKARWVVFPNENPGDPATDCVDAVLTAGLVDEDIKISRWMGIP